VLLDTSQENSSALDFWFIGSASNVDQLNRKFFHLNDQSLSLNGKD